MAQGVHRTARIRLRLTAAQRRRCFGLLVAAGDVWAMVLDCNAALGLWRLRPIVGFAALCREITGMRFGELARLPAEDVLKRSCAWFEAARRRGAGQDAGFPRRKRRLVAVRFRKGTFSIEGPRVRLATRKGSPELWVRLSRAIPYPLGAIRSVTLLWEAGKLYLDVTAQVAVERHDLDPARIAGIDLGIIHPFAAVAEGEALLVSGRALRAEERLHLEDTKRRQQRTAPRAPSKGQRGSRRWRRIRASQRRAEARHRRRVRQGQHTAAKEVVSWAVARGVGTLVVGDPAGITEKDQGESTTSVCASGGGPTFFVRCATRPSGQASESRWWTSEGPPPPAPSVMGEFRSPRAGGSPAPPAGSEGTATSSVPATSPPEAAGY